MAKPFFAYILLCANNSYYVGHTDNLERRFAEHQEGVKCVYTSNRRPVRLIWSQDFATREEAKAAEARIKKWSRVKKAALAKGDFDGLQAAAKKKDWEGYYERRKHGIPD